MGRKCDCILFLIRLQLTISSFAETLDTTANSFPVEKFENHTLGVLKISQTLLDHENWKQKSATWLNKHLGKVIFEISWHIKFHRAIKDFFITKPKILGDIASLATFRHLFMQNYAWWREKMLTLMQKSGKMKWPIRDLNPGPSALRSGVLTSTPWIH